MSRSVLETLKSNFHCALARPQATTSWPWTITSSGRTFMSFHHATVRDRCFPNQTQRCSAGSTTKVQTTLQSPCCWQTLFVECQNVLPKQSSPTARKNECIQAAET